MVILKLSSWEDKYGKYEYRMFINTLLNKISKLVTVWEAQALEPKGKGCYQKIVKVLISLNVVINATQSTN